MKLADIFGSNMVLQRNKRICIFGEGDGSGCIEFNGTGFEFVSENGGFKVYLPPMSEGGPYSMKVTLNGKTQTIENILIGDVYIAGGQSNMQFQVRESADIFPKSCEYVRYFNEGHDGDKYLEGLPCHCNEGWKVATEDNSASFSAIGFEFATELYRKTGVPIGIIGCCQGASRVDTWTEPETVCLPEYQALMPEKHYDYSTYKFNKDCWLYTNKLLHITPFPICGVLFYQGESNTGTKEAENYGKLLEYMIQNWRRVFEDPYLPFYIVQIAGFEISSDIANWAEVRAQQQWASKNISDTYLITMSHTGEEKLIHPCKKKRLAVSLVNAVMNIRYGENIEYCGPVAEAFIKEESGVKILFSHADGLHIKGEYLEGAWVYGQDGETYPVTAEINKNVLTLKWKKGTNATGVAIGYKNSPKHNLYNAAGYLASPFRYTFE